jgi:hypothetical protein
LQHLPTALLPLPRQVPTPVGDCFSTGVCSDNNPYGVAPGLIFSFPCTSKVRGTWILFSLLVRGVH